MEFVGQPSASGACSLLGVPGLSTLGLDVDDDESELAIGIRPRSSPLPRRRSSVSDEDSEPEPPLCGSRRVSFADAKGLSLAQVKEFDCWDVPKLPGYESSESQSKDTEEYFLSPLTFCFPLSTEELFIKVREQKVELETIELLPGTTMLKGVIRVLNISFTKAVYVRTSLDTWSSHFDLLAEYIPGSSDSLTDCFSFKLTLVPPFGEQGARIDFCLRYETSVGTFWANNNNSNYVLFCQPRVKKETKRNEKRETVNKKSCLKTISQNFTVENVLAIEDSSQENISTGVPKQKVDAVKTKPLSDCQSVMSKENGQKLLAESRQNCSRRHLRKAARMARVKDFFAQRDGASERDESPLEAKQAAQEDTSNVQPFSEESSKSKGSHCKPILCDTSLIHNYTLNSEPETSESISLADSLTGGESATDIRHNSLHSNNDPAPEECKNTNKSVSKAEESSQKPGMSHEYNSSIQTGPADGVISTLISQSIVSNTNSFTFGTVMAPLYHQVFGSECQSVGDWGNPLHTPLNVESVTQYYPLTDKEEGSCTVSTEARGNNDKVKGDLTESQDSKQESLHSPPFDEEETSVMMTNNILDHKETDPIICSGQRCTNTSEDLKTLSGDTLVHPHSVNILDTDVSHAQIPTESYLQSQTTTETVQAQLPEHTCAQTKINLDETCTQNETEQVFTSPETSFMSLHLSQRVPEQVSDETDTRCGGSSDSKCAPHISLETHEEANAVREENEGAVLSNHHRNDDVFVELKDEDTSKEHHEMVAAEKIEHHEMVAAASKEDDFCLVGTAEVKNWEMMVEEEEENILTYEEQSMSMNLKADDNEAVEKDQEKPLAEAGIETVSKNKDTTETGKKKTENQTGDKITAARGNQNVADDDALVNGEEQIAEPVDGQDWEEVRKEVQYIEATKTEAGEDGLAEETEIKKRENQEETELGKEKHFADMQEVKIESINVHDGNEIEGEEETEIELNGDDEVGVGSDIQVKPRKKNVDKDILIEGTSAIVDAESMNIGGNEVGWFEERLDLTQNNVKNGLSAPVHNVQEQRVINKESTGENEMHLYQEEAFHRNKNVAHDSSTSERDDSESTAAEGGSCGLQENDQLSHNSASSESDSDDEVELYMHCLRAVHAGTQTSRDRSKDTGFNASLTVNRSKLLTTRMPSITESLDEEQHLSCLQDNLEDKETVDVQTIAAVLPASSGQESINRKMSWCIETFSCRNFARILLYATLLMLFVVVSYYYDFIACFGIYLISVIWLCCQGERQPIKNNNRIG